MRTLLFVIVLCFVFFVGCDYTTKKTFEKTQVVERVFMHEPNDFSFMFFKPETNELKTERYGCDDRHLKIISDVAPNNKPWFYFATFDINNDSRDYNVLTIHIRNVKDIGGGGWNHGKLGSGRTSVLE